MSFQPQQPPDAGSVFDPNQAVPPIHFGAWGDDNVGPGLIGSSGRPAVADGSVEPGAGVLGVNTAVQGVGVQGYCRQGTGVAGLGGGTGTGVAGRADTGAGVSGTSAQGVGVFGQGGGSSPGVSGAGAAGPGVFGASAQAAGVLGSGVAGPAVSGVNTQGVGVFGQGAGSSPGVSGSGTAGPGVSGTSAQGAGVSGSGTAGPGVSGTSAQGAGVSGQGTAGPGVSGVSTQGFGLSGQGVLAGVFGSGVDPSGAGQDGPGVSGNSGQSPGVLGTSAQDNGVFGHSDGSGSAGVFGSSSQGPGVMGKGAAGQPGLLGATLSGSAVFARSEDGTGVEAQGTANGVLATATTGAGVFATASDAAGTALIANGTNAAALEGDVRVFGQLFKSGGGFQIDHPQDPEHRVLSHSFVESSERKNIYDGMAVLDDQGQETVTLPSWFTALNTDLRFQLTPLDAPAPNIHVARHDTGDGFDIRGGPPGLEVCWQVTGVRADAWALAHPLAEEEDKPAEEHGSYLHPEAFGEPAEKGVGYRRYPHLRRPTGTGTGADPAPSVRSVTPSVAAAGSRLEDPVVCAGGAPRCR